MEMSNEFLPENSEEKKNSNEPQQVVNVVEQPKEQEVINKQVENAKPANIEKVNEVNPEENKGLKFYPNSQFVINNLESVTNYAGPLFSIDIPSNKFTEQLILNNGSPIGIQRVGNMTLKLSDELGIGVNMCLNTTQGANSINFCLPAVTNSLLISVYEEDPAVISLSEEANSVYTAPGLKSDKMQRALLISNWYVFQSLNDNAHTYDEDLGSDLYGGLSLKDEKGYTYRIETRALRETNLSYGTQTLELFKQINVNAIAPKSLVNPLTYAPFKSQNLNYVPIYTYIYNKPYQDAYCYSPVLEQLKLLFYCDMWATNYDMIEGLNQQMSNGCPLWKYNSRLGAEVVTNVNTYREAGGVFCLSWLSFNQYLEYQENPVGYLHQSQTPAWDMNREWQFVPIKKQWLNDKKALAAYLVSILPYPIIGLCTRVSGFQDLTISANYVLNVKKRLGWIEHMDSRVDISGYVNICLVVVDYGQNDPIGVDDNYLGLWTFPQVRPNAGDYVVINAHTGHEQAGFEVYFHRYIIEYLIYILEMDPINHPLALLELWTSITNWQVYDELLNIVAYFSTSNENGWASPVDKIKLYPSQQLCSLLVPLHVTEVGVHMWVDDPSFDQRLYALIGLVRQAGAHFLMPMDVWVYRDLILSRRYAIASIKTDLIDKNRETVRMTIPQKNRLNPQIQIVREQFMHKFNNYIKYDPSAFKNEDTAFAGFVRYIQQETLAGETTASAYSAEIELNNYGGLLDWVNLFSTVEVGKSQRVRTISNKPIEGNHIIERSKVIRDALYYIPNKQGDKSRMDYVLKSLNDTFGRALEYRPNNANQFIGLDFWANVIKTDTYGHPIIWPYWKFGPWTWIADAAYNAPKAFGTSWPNCLMTPYPQDWNFPYVRVYDYQIPRVENKELRRLLVFVHSDLMFKVSLYVNINKYFDQNIVTEEDYINKDLYD